MGHFTERRSCPSTTRWPRSSPSAIATSVRSWRRPTRIGVSSSPRRRWVTCRRTPRASPVTDAPNGTIFDRLEHYDITWRDYYPDLPTAALFLPELPRQPDRREAGAHQPIPERCRRGPAPPVLARRPVHQLLGGGRRHLHRRGLSPPGSSVPSWRPHWAQHRDVPRLRRARWMVSTTSRPSPRCGPTTCRRRSPFRRTSPAAMTRPASGSPAWSSRRSPGGTSFPRRPRPHQLVEVHGDEVEPAGHDLP